MSRASPSPPDSSLDEATEEGFILASINTLLNRVGISAKPINSFEELRKSASSMFVAIFEAMFQVRQKGVVRKPAHVHNYVHNAQMVVDALAGPILNMDLSHITGEAIVRGDTVAIRNLVDIFMGISEVVIKRQGRPQSEAASKKLWSGSRRRLKVRQGTPQRGNSSRHQHVQHNPHLRGVHVSPGDLHPTLLEQSGGGVAIRTRESWPTGGRDATREDYEFRTDTNRLRHEAKSKGEEDGSDDGTDDEGGESIGKSELSPFLCDVGSFSSAPGASLMARDILEANGVLEDDDEGVGDYGIEDESVGQFLARPVRDAEIRVDHNTRREEEEREMKYRLYYQRVLKDRLTALRKRELADARKQRYVHKNATHLARVRQIKKERMEENLRLARLSQRMRFEDGSRGRLNHLYKKILTALHRQRKEDDREDAARLKALHLAWQAQSDDLEKFFNERVELIVAHEQGSSRERAQAMAAQERDLIDMFRHAETEYEARLLKQMEQQAMEAAAQERHKSEVLHAYKELLRMEDWSGASRDRFLGVRPNTAFEQRLKQVRVRADRARSRLLKEKKEKELLKAYGRAF